MPLSRPIRTGGIAAEEAKPEVVGEPHSRRASGHWTLPPHSTRRWHGRLSFAVYHPELFQRT